MTTFNKAKKDWVHLSFSQRESKIRASEHLIPQMKEGEYREAHWEMLQWMKLNLKP